MLVLGDVETVGVVCEGELDYGGEKKKKGKAVCRKNRAEKLILCQL